MSDLPQGTALQAAAETAVVTLAIAGDPGAFDELVRRRQRALRSLLRRLCRNASLADDLAQQSFVAAWRALGTLRSPGAFPGWLRRIAVRAWLQHQRRGIEASISMQVLTEPPVVSTDGSAESIDLHAALMELTAAQRLCVVLAYHEGLSHREISLETGIPLGTVKSHVTRGAVRLRELLNDYEGTP